MKKYWGFIAIALALLVLTYFTGSGCSESAPGKVPPHELKVIGSSTFLSGSEGSMRVIAFDPSTGKGVKGVPVSIYLEKDSNRKTVSNISPVTGTPVINPEAEGDKIFSGKTTETGSLDVSFSIPEYYEGSRKLFIVTGAGEQINTIDTSINIVKQYKIYLTTDKPLYQPGQIINIRAMSLKIPTMKPVAKDEVTFEIQDGKGNKVFKLKTTTSKFGIASAKFQLADEVNMGDYHIRATLLGKESAEKNVSVKKYVLPKFKVAFTKDRKFYTPGNTIKGDVQADYFFGKPVSNGTVKVKLYTFDFEFKQAAEVKGKTDKDGHYSFELKIPDYLVGQPLDKGKAVAKVDIELTDTAKHKEVSVQMVPVSKEALKVELFPESGRLKTKVDNLIYAITSYPDGSPVKADVEIKIDGVTKNITTDDTGVATFNYTPKSPNAPTIQVTARTKKGEKAAISTYIPIDNKNEGIIVRTDKATYKAGETLNIEVLASNPGKTVYVDFIKNNQTILTKAVDMNGAKKVFSMDITPDMAGLVTVHAYRFTTDNDIVRDTKNIFIENSQDLKISIKPDKAQYGPAQEAKIRFNVKNSSGSPVAAALGVDIVDEAVFAMGDMMPGFEKVYFLLEKELMEPKYEIHGLTMTGAITEPESKGRDQQTMRKILFSQLPQNQQQSINIDTYRNKLEKCHYKMVTVMDALYTYHRKHNKWLDPDDIDLLVSDGILKEEDLLDPWNNKFTLVKHDNGKAIPDIRSSGPDGRIGSKDDIFCSKVLEGYWNSHPGVFADAEGRWADGNGRANLRFKYLAEAEGAPNFATDTSGNMRLPGGNNAGQKQVRIREYFPETLYTNPEVITDDNGNAEITLAVADSITTWRISAAANSAEGLMGNATLGLKVFQDFFIDIDFPVALTRGDEVSVPIAVYNYLKVKQVVKLKVDTSQKWFKLLDKAQKSITLNSGEVSVVYFRIKTQKIGRHKLTVFANGTKFSDAIKREIEIVPDGKMFVETKSGRLDQGIKSTINIPKSAVPGASKIMVSVYPGIISQVIDGLDKVFQMPCGCFEQTTASTYPNVLVLDYLKRQKKITPEIQMKAEGYINTGYQRLVSFEVPGGGFSWFGDAPANRCLTALGILEFRDMSKVHNVDENLINRTQQWLAGQQNKDGSWSPDSHYLHQESWGKMQDGGNIPVTAYIVWALAESGYKGQDLLNGIKYLKDNAGQIDDPYILALTCNALTQLEPDGKITRQMLEKLRSKATIEGDTAYWGTKLQTATYTHGDAANIETTALATLACIKASGYEELASKGIAYLVKAKDPNGTWYSTQGTVLSMKALLLSQDKAVKKMNAKVKISVNGKRSEEFDVNSENFDVYKMADFGDVTSNGENSVALEISGEGACYYQVTTRYYMPWKNEAPGMKPLAIKVSYDRTKLKTDDTLTATVSLRNNTKFGMKMVMADLGLPPGFTLISTDLDEMVGKKFKKYTATSRQAIIYIDTLKPGEELQFKYRLKARYPMKAQVPESKTYQYYNPEVKDIARPQLVEVK